MYSMIIILLLCCIHISQGYEDCVFKKSELPPLEKHLIKGDVRRLERCQKTQLPSPYPPKHSPGKGIMPLFSREEYIMANLIQANKTTDSTFQLIEDTYFSDVYMYSEYFRQPKFSNFFYLRMPKTGSSSINKDIAMDVRNRTKVRVGIKNRKMFSFTTIKHPFSRFISALDTIANRYAWRCLVGGVLRNRNFIPNEEKLRDRYYNPICVEMAPLLRRLRALRGAAEDSGWLALKLLHRWGGALAYTPKELGPHPMYLAHLFSQMFFHNMVSQRDDVKTLNDQKERHVFERPTLSIDYYFEIKYYDEEVKKLKQEDPNTKLLPSFTEFINQHEGKLLAGPEHLFSCRLGWAVYEYYKQDFECFGYKLPDICYQTKCMEGIQF